MLDSVALATIVLVLGLIGLTVSFADRNPFYVRILQIMGPITAFCTAGTFRIVIKYANFKRWQNIWFKIMIFTNGIVYFMIGAYIMYSNYKLSQGILPSIDSQYKDFSLLFVFSGMAFYKEICNLHNRFDLTNKLKYKYKLVDEV